jgi:hypothetical protein
VRHPEHTIVLFILDDSSDVFDLQPGAGDSLDGPGVVIREGFANRVQPPVDLT